MKRKRCIKCGRRRTLSMYYTHPGMADGHLNKCKDCCRRDVKDNKKRNRDRYREYERERARRPERRASQLEYQREYRKRNREKMAAQRKVAYHVQRGNMTPKPCNVCGTTVHVHAHHEDYNRPLDVIWLCAEHHKAAHMEEE
jgi:hypothetical protein